MVSLLPLLPTPVAPVAPAGTVTAGTPAASLRTRANAGAAAALLAGPPPTPTHVLLIGTDGTNLDKILADPVANAGFINHRGPRGGGDVGHREGGRAPHRSGNHRADQSAAAATGGRLTVARAGAAAARGRPCLIRIGTFTDR